MSIEHALSHDSRAVVLLCSTLGLAESEGDGLRPLRPRDWNDLAQRIQASSLNGPGAMLGLTADDLSVALGLGRLDADRIRSLLDRGGQLAIEVERLASRGIWILTRVDPDYPATLRESLKHSAPPVLFGAGETSLLSRAGIAVIGSRNIDAAGHAFAEQIAGLCARDGLPVISGGARGTDAIAMGAALEAGGTAVGVLADSLERVIRAPDVREPLTDARLTLVTPYWPSVGFSVPGAMGRNKIIYGLADYAVVVASDFEKGGTWAGAVEALKGGFCPVFVRVADDAPEGNRELARKGAIGLRGPDLETTGDLIEWMEERSREMPQQLELVSTEKPESSYQPLLPIAEQGAGTGTREAVDLFDVAWPHLKPFLAQPRTVDEIRDAFQIEKSQAAAWLKRAQEERKVAKRGKPVRYQAIP